MNWLCRLELHKWGKVFRAPVFLLAIIPALVAVILEWVSIVAEILAKALVAASFWMEEFGDPGRP